MESNRICVFLVTKDRPLQAQFLLNSLWENGNILKYAQIYSLVKYSNDRYKTAYKKIWATEAVHEREEQSFKSSFLSLLEELKNNHTYVLALTDDTVFYRPFHFSFQQIFDNFERNPDLLTLSLRLGRNTTQQNPDDVTDILTIPTEFTELNGKIAIWDWTKESGNKNTGYPISMDGHIYRIDDFLKLSQSIEFNNLREWEGELVSFVRNARNIEVPPLMACFENSYCVNSSVNIVQPPFYSTVGPYGHTINELLERYENGYYIDFEETFEGIEVKGSHQYLDYKFKKMLV